MISIRPISDLPIAAIPAEFLAERQEVTLRYASRTFTTRSTDAPANTTLEGRIKSVRGVQRQLRRGDGGQFGSLIKTTLGDIELDNIDGALDVLGSDFFVDGREVRLKIGATETVRSRRALPRWIAAKATAASADASVPFVVNYPDDGVLKGDFFLARLTINDRGQAGLLSSVPTGWTALAQDNAGVITEDARTAYNGGSSADPHTFNHTAGAGADFLIVKIAYENTRDVIDVKWGGAAGTSLTKDVGSAREHASGAINTQIWYLAAPATGTQEVWIDFSANATNVGAEAVTLIGAHQTNPVVDSNGGTTTNGDSVTADGALVVDGTNWLEVIAEDGAGGISETYTWNGSIVEDNAINTGASNFTAGHQADVVSNVTPSVTRDGGGNPQDWALSAILLRAGALHQALLYRFADGTESGQTASFDWQSGDAANDAIAGRIDHFRYVDPDVPIESLVPATIGGLTPVSMPSLETFTANSLAVACVSWSDNVNTGSPIGEIGGDWEYVGDLVSTGLGDDAASRIAVAEMPTPGEIQGGEITATPSSPFSQDSVIRAFAVRGLPLADEERVQPLTNFATVYTSVVGAWSFERPVVRLRMKDLGALLQDRLQLLTYAGTGGVSGTADLTGRSRPTAFGHVLNIPAQLVDPANLIYQLHSRAMQEVASVYDAGIALTFNADYADFNALAAATVPSGEFATSLATGFIRLGSAPVGSVTADILGDNVGGYVRTHAAIMKRILLDFSPLAEADLDLSSFTVLDLLQPAEAGIFFPAGDQSTAEQAVQRVALSGGAFAGQDRSGLYRVGQLAAPLTTPHWIFDDRNIVHPDGIEQERLPFGEGVPWKAWAVGYERNWTLQGSSELAAGVTQARRQFLESEYRWAFFTSTPIALNHRSSATAPFREALFLNRADAEAEAERLAELYGLGVAQYRVRVKDVLFSVRIGDTARVIFDRWTLQQGRSFVVVAVSDDADRRETELVLFG